jgi:hypothetical protein
MDRHTETRISELKNEAGEVIGRVTETWVEKVPMELQTRTIEKVAPVVMSRTTETYDGEQLVESTTEAIPRDLAPAPKAFVPPVLAGNNIDWLTLLLAAVCGLGIAWVIYSVI